MRLSSVPFVTGNFRNSNRNFSPDGTSPEISVPFDLLPEIVLLNGSHSGNLNNFQIFCKISKEVPFAPVSKVPKILVE